MNFDVKTFISYRAATKTVLSLWQVCFNVGLIES